MCNPVLAIAGAQAILGVGSAVMQYQGAKNQAEAAAKTANIEARLRSEGEQARAVEVGQRAANEKFETAIQKQQAMGRIAASASDRGLGAQSVNRSFNVAAFQAGRANSITELNAKNQLAQGGRNLRSIEAERQATIAANPAPSPWSLALGIGSAVANAGASYYSLKG